jgi:hypothetical protein
MLSMHCLQRQTSNKQHNIPGKLSQSFENEEKTHWLHRIVKRLRWKHARQLRYGGFSVELTNESDARDLQYITIQRRALSMYVIVKTLRINRCEVRRVNMVCRKLLRVF